MAADGDAFDRDCPGRSVLGRIASRWGVLILSALVVRPMRFYELRDRVDGISEKVLAQNLRALVQDGLVTRTVHPTNPPQVSYALTELGAGLNHPLQALLDWIMVHTVDIVAARQRHAEVGSRGV
ncbi:winged helix-turn-helix transcriptional regulator [Pseudonocardia sp. TRM90224]|uniref:winged helix-turn-helix transcriptional regulator n=1 Tax=Pseudonocardia sp. TRM90224 TaxID=2812678 RepID=UPI001E400330|nr:helix-turn-helix domain-containing protein [Pseudonocardia sp. TRM90224]